jgi:hypothetical protein
VLPALHPFHRDGDGIGSEVELQDLNILTTNLFQEQIGNFRETSKLLNFVRPKLPQLYQ